MERRREVERESQTVKEVEREREGVGGKWTQEMRKGGKQKLQTHTRHTHTHTHTHRISVLP